MKKYSIIMEDYLKGDPYDRRSYKQSIKRK